MVVRKVYAWHSSSNIGVHRDAARSVFPVSSCDLLLRRRIYGIERERPPPPLSWIDPRTEIGLGDRLITPKEGSPCSIDTGNYERSFAHDPVIYPGDVRARRELAVCPFSPVEWCPLSPYQSFFPSFFLFFLNFKSGISSYVCMYVCSFRFRKIGVQDNEYNLCKNLG